ncbi:hypothetical protein D3C77_699550 [compost metagenome]
MLVLLLHLGSKRKQSSLFNPLLASLPYLRKQHNLTALNLILQLNEGHSLTLLGRNRFE